MGKDELGEDVGVRLGCELGILLGEALGSADGALEGRLVGSALGVKLGAEVGDDSVGPEVGILEGVDDGTTLGYPVGFEEGILEGPDDGTTLGAPVSGQIPQIAGHESALRGSLHHSLEQYSGSVTPWHTLEIQVPHRAGHVKFNSGVQKFGLQWTGSGRPLHISGTHELQVIGHEILSDSSQNKTL